MSYASLRAAFGRSLVVVAGSLLVVAIDAPGASAAAGSNEAAVARASSSAPNTLSVARTGSVADVKLETPINEPLVPAQVPQPLRPWAQARFYQGGQPDRCAWRLVVLNGGRLRGQTSSDSSPSNSDSALTAWPALEMGEAFWLMRIADRAPGVLAARFGHAGGAPVWGDWDGDGRAEVGAFINGQWFLDLNGNGRWDDHDLFVRLGAAGDWPVTGDWDGDGKTDIGVFSRATAADADLAANDPGQPDAGNHRASKVHSVSNSSDSACQVRLGADHAARAFPIRHVFLFGSAGDIPVVGDWNGDGVYNVGIFRRGRWVLDSNGDGRYSEGDKSFDLGAEQDVPVVGDFNGDGISNVGVYRRGAWLLDTNGDYSITQVDSRFEFGTPTDLPLIADFQGEGHLRLSVYRPDASRNKSL
jgi:hypothetical protein